MAQGTPTSQVRIIATPVFPADMQTVGLHLSGEVGNSLWLEKPDCATHIKLQALGDNIRYKIDAGTIGASVATSTDGFQLPKGSESLIPVPNRGISLAQETSGATYQAQWME